MPLMCGDRTFLDDKTIPMEYFWERMLAGESVKTSQPSPDSYLREFREAKQAGDAVVCVCLSSALSGTWQSAQMARELAEYEDIFLVDSRCAAGSEKLLTLEACRLRDEGKHSAAEIALELEEFRRRIRIFACIDTLEYLVQGGRLSRAAGNIGTLLNLKPYFCFDPEGNIQVLKKVPGLNHVMHEICRQIAEIPIDPAYPVLPLYACDRANCDSFLRILHESLPLFQAYEPEEIGAIIGSYIGPGGFGVTFIEKKNTIF